MEKKKGQASIIIVLGVMIFLIVVIIFVSQRALISKPEPSGIGQLKDLVKSDLQRELGALSLDIIATIASHGGFLDPPSFSIQSKLGDKIPYWQICQNTHTPSISEFSESIKRGVERELKLNKQKILEKLSSSYKKDIELGDLKGLDVSIKNEEVEIDFFIRVALEGFSLEQPIKVRVPVSLGRAYRFASNFVEQNSKERIFERFMTSLIYHADPNKIPNSNVLLKCGEFVFKTWDQIKPTAEGIIDYGLKNIVFWREPPPEESREYLDYYVPNVSGETYPDLDISFERPLELTRKTFQPSQSPVSIANSRQIWMMIPHCVTGYDIEYSMETPLIASVKSKDIDLKFGILPRVVNSKIALCENIEGYKDAGDACKDEANCEASVEVVNSKGEPLPGTKVAFGACEIGETNSRGIAKGKMPCGVSELNVYNPEYNYHYDILDHTQMAGKKVILKKNPDLILHFNRAYIWPRVNGTVLAKDKVARWNHTEVITFAATDELVYAVFKKINPKPWETDQVFVANKDETNTTVPILHLNYLEPGNYEAEINIHLKANLEIRFCKKMRWSGGCVRHQYINESFPIHSTVKYNITINEDDKDIYLNAYEPGISVLREAKFEWDYTGEVPQLAPCILPVSRAEPEGKCIIAGDQRKIAHYVMGE